jgi:hypothetical protein
MRDKTNLKSNKNIAEQGPALSKNERNGELNIKPTLHNNFNNKFYIPGSYLNPFGLKDSKY